MPETMRYQLLRMVSVSTVLLLLLMATTVAAKDPAIGKVIAIRGQATIGRAEIKQTLQLGGEIRSKDIVRTGQRCRLQIMFTDNTIISLGPVSEFIVKDYAWDETARQGKMTSEVKEGVFRILGGSITKKSPEQFITETPGATIGIRGSMYAGSVRDGQLRVVFQGGRGIYVRNELGSVDIKTPGFGTRIDKKGQAPLQPYRFAQKELKQIDPLNAPPPEEQPPPSEEQPPPSEEQPPPSEEQPPPSEEQPPPSEEQPPPSEEPPPPLGDQPPPSDGPPPASGSGPLPALADASLSSPEDQSILLSPDTQLLLDPQLLPVDSPQQQSTTDQSMTLLTPTLAANMPTTGISKFLGPASGTLRNISTSVVETIGDSFELLANWHNGKVFGTIMEPADHEVVYFIGDISGTTFTTSQFIGNDITDIGSGPVLAVSGSTTVGQFIGASADGAVFDFYGNTYEVETQDLEETWQLSGSGSRPSVVTSSTTGTVNWSGFAVGVGEDMAAIDVNRRIFYSQVASDFTLTLNRDAGTVSGNLSAFDAASGTQIISMPIGGGANPSAYISDNAFAAKVGGGDPILSGTTGPLKTYGNFLVTEDHGNRLAQYVTWGPWEIAYSDPGSSADYHVHMPGASWVAGELTSLAEIGALTFSATYRGQAEGVYVPSVGQYFDMPSGSISLDVNFGSSSVTGGSISFPAGNGAPAVSLGIASTTFGGREFNTLINSPDTGYVNGAFFGPNAASVGGNFAAQTGSDRVLGVFGADR